MSDANRQKDVGMVYLLNLAFFGRLLRCLVLVSPKKKHSNVDSGVGNPGTKRKNNSHLVVIGMMV